MDDLTTAPTDLLAKHIATTRCIVYTRRLKNTERLARPFPVFLSFLHAHADVFESLFAPWTYDSHKPPNSKSPLYAIFRDEWLPLACAKLAAYMDEHPIPAEMSAALWDALYDVCKTKRTQLSTGQPGPRALKGWEPNEMSMAHMADSETSTPPPMDMYEQMRAKGRLVAPSADQSTNREARAPTQEGEGTGLREALLAPVPAPTATRKRAREEV